MRPSPLEWRRGPRSTFALGHETGVYALFLREGSTLPALELAERQLLYIGLAANRKGLKGRCHFNARTRNHSPRKSLAVLLMDALGLVPVLIAKPNSADTWGLDATSDARLSQWLHDNLDLAVEICADVDVRETELVCRYVPPLNLAKCAQTPTHRRIAEARAGVLAGLQGRAPQAIENRAGHTRTSAKASANLVSVETESVPTMLDPACRSGSTEFDTAEAIAARFGLNPKSYRQRLRASILWYRKPQDWSFPVGSTEWHDMIAVAEKMAC
jgi:hypothetical protein